MRREIRGTDGSIIGYTNSDSNGRVTSCYDPNGNFLGTTDRDNGTFDKNGNRTSLDSVPGLNFPRKK